MGSGATLQEYLSVVGFDEWTRIEGSYRAAGVDTGNRGKDQPIRP
jgi:hypothetical protein